MQEGQEPRGREAAGVRIHSPPKPVSRPSGGLALRHKSPRLPLYPSFFLLVPSLSCTSSVCSPRPPATVSLPVTGGREVWWEEGMSSDMCLPGWFEGSLK